jgi:hypothetical protein
LIIEKSLAEPPRPTGHSHKPPWKRQFAVWSRWLHIYLSMASFAILFFFAATGLTLNHTEWFASHQRTIQRKASIDPAWLKPEVRKLEIVERLRSAHAIRGAMTDFRIDDTQCSVSFKGPGYTADAFIDRATGAYDLTETRNGFFAVMNDLHKGRDSGRIWSWLIDASAVLMAFVSLSGFVLIFLLARKRTSGLLVALAGALICWALYSAFVP